MASRERVAPPFMGPWQANDAVGWNVIYIRNRHQKPFSVQNERSRVRSSSEMRDLSHNMPPNLNLNRH